MVFSIATDRRRSAGLRVRARANALPFPCASGSERRNEK
jgi:hypothetical protein